MVRLAVATRGIGWWFQHSLLRDYEDFEEWTWERQVEM